MRDEKDGYVVNLMTTGDKRSVVLPNVPSLSELGVNIPKGMQSAHKFVTSGGPAVFLPPGVSPERVEYLRKAFQILSDNTELQKAIEKLTGHRNPFTPGQEVQKEMAEIKADQELAVKLDAIYKKYSAVQ
jgi:tripartite-type tricarboxylate transporter receptor subunit TctC